MSYDDDEGCVTRVKGSPKLSREGCRCLIFSNFLLVYFKQNIEEADDVVRLMSYFAIWRSHILKSVKRVGRGLR